MRILIINTSEQIGGAAIAARRLMEALTNSGIQAKMLVRDKQTRHLAVVALRSSWLNRCKFVWERIVIWAANRFHRHQLFAVDIANTGIDITQLPEFRQADVIHLHWVNQGMLSLRNIAQIIASGKPIVWTMHDMWPFTAICHYSGGCERYETYCGRCPMLYGGGSAKDIAYRTFEKKQQLIGKTRITFVACSHWLEQLAKKSALLRGQTVISIPNAINIRLFHPKDKSEARRRCGLPLDKQLLLFGSLKITDKRKGVDYLVEACRRIRAEQPALSATLGVVVVGKEADSLTYLIPFPLYNMAYVGDERRMVDIYNAVDLYVTPSLQDNLPNTIVEAMACGVPCVGFHVGGIPQMIDHLHDGYVAEYRSASDLANGIVWALGEGDCSALSEQARRKAVSSYSEASVAKQYIDVYNSVISDEP